MVTALRQMRGGPPLVDKTAADRIALDIIERTGGDIRLALPLGLGKPVTLLNALTRAVAERSDVQLSILTALTLERPDMSGGMARRFLAPAEDRLSGQYPQVAYAQMMRDGTLPDNIEVSEFFMQAGRWLSQPLAQRRYIAANYTHALDVLRRWKPNVLMQLLAPVNADTLSLSCNTDITVDLLRDRRAGKQEFIVVGEVNTTLPAMSGPEAVIDRAEVQILLEEGPQFELFSVVKRPVGHAEHAIGLHVARLIRDGGTLQIGIGAIGDAVAHALILRHAGKTLGIQRKTPFAQDGFDEDGAFDTGLYVVTEMLVDGILQLFEAGIVRREVDGVAIHAGFFVDCREFYARLRNLSDEDRKRIRMMPVSFTNQLYGNERAKRAARTDARFVNAAMKVTVLGGVTSDINSSGQEVSGIGGQFNFIEQAFTLEGARSIITLPATRVKAGKTTSNIVWSHPHESVPRAYRDIVVTEYGIADLRGVRDEVAIARMVRIADSRFQDGLVEQAKKADKLAQDFEIPDGWRCNTPRQLEDWLLPFAMPAFPFGTDFDAIEQRLLPALDLLSKTQGDRSGMVRLIVAGLGAGKGNGDCLNRMNLGSPRTIRAWVEALALKGALRQTD